MSWLLAFLGFAALIILHEFGHFAAAKAVGMRVERFALFFPPLIAKVRRGETEYAIGAVPLGGYVKITGMNPTEAVPPEVAHRSYYRQPVWKRLVVISAGPIVNIVIAFVMIWGLVLDAGFVNRQPTSTVEEIAPGFPAQGKLQPGDRVVAVDGRRGSWDLVQKQTATHTCAGKLVDGCRAETPARFTVLRDGREKTLTLRPVYDAEVRAMRVGFTFATRQDPATVTSAAGEALDQMWFVTKTTVVKVVRIFDPDDRKDLSSVVGGYETTRQAIEAEGRIALYVIALISLSLGIINLFPFLPLDGGHIFWAVAEKVARRPIPFAVMEKSGYIGFALVMLLFFVGLNNDITRIREGSDFLPR